MSEICLVFDATNVWITVGIFTDSVRAQKTLREARTASTRLMPLIQDMLKETGVERPTWLICARGPGSFTGSRIGVSTGRNLAQLWEIPVLGIDSLAYYGYHCIRMKDARTEDARMKDARTEDATMESARMKDARMEDAAMESATLDGGTGKIAVLIDGKQNRVYARVFASGRRDFESSTMHDIAPAELFRRLDRDVEIYADNPDAIRAYLGEESPFPAPVVLQQIPEPRAESLYELGIFLGGRRRAVAWENLLPIYLRRDPASVKYPEGYNP